MKPRITGLHHDHIDGSLPVVKILPELYELSGMNNLLPTMGIGEGIDELVQFFQNPQEDIVKRFGLVTGGLQTTESIRRATREYAKTRAREGFRYVEAYFAPQYHTKFLSMRKVAYEFVTSLKSAADDYDMRIFPHICIGREADADTGIEIAKIALEFDGEVALNLVCDEANNPPEKHLPAYKLTFGSKVRRDCHAGEWVHREPRETYRRRLLDNICTAIFDLRCDGIGHAISLADHEHLVQYVADNGIRVSGCPLSNLRCGLITSVYDLRIDYLLDAGVCYTLNPDDDFFLPAMPEVIAVCDEAYRFTPEQARKLEKNVILGAFAR